MTSLSDRLIVLAVLVRGGGLFLVSWFMANQPVLAAELAVCRYGVGAAAASSQFESDRRHYAPDRPADVLHIKLDVTPDFERRTVRGTATIRFRPIARPLEELKLDGVNLRVSAVRGSQPVASFSADDEHVTIVFDDPVPADAEAQVEIDYEAEPQMGLYFRTPGRGAAAGDEHLWTQGETHEARHWFPCFDWPHERSTSEILCRVPAGMTAVANGRLVAEADAGGGLRSFHWRMEKSHPAYLICLVAGKLAKLEAAAGKLPLAFYTQPSMRSYAARPFADTADVIGFFEQEIGVPFPWEKYDQATVGDFMWGGMENTTLTTLTQRALADAASENVREARSLVAHELAHQWFGDYVTCKDWSCLWLNEGFATYYAHLFEEHKFGRDALLFGLYEDLRDEILPNLADKRPIAYRQYKSAGEQFDFRNYPKASWVLHMLRSQVGTELYRRAIRTYLERHALGAVETEDLREVFEELSGRPLDRFFDQWIYHGGLPELKVEYSWLAQEKLAKFTVEQTQTVGDDVLLFHLPAKLRVIVDGQTTDRPIEIDAKKQDFFVPAASEPTVVRFDPEFATLAKVDFKISDKLLEAQLAQQGDALGRVLACAGLAERKTAAAVAALKSALQKDPFFGVRLTAADALAAIGTQEAAEALAESVAQPDARVRLRVVEALGKSYRAAARDALARLASQEKNPAVAAAAVAGLARVHGDDATAALRSALTARSLRNEQPAAALLAAGEYGDPALSGDLMQTIRRREGEINAYDLSVGMTSLAKLSQRGVRRRTAALEFLAGYLDSPREPLRLGAAAALGELGDPRARLLLDPLSRVRGDERLAKAAADALARLDKQSPPAPAELSDLRREVRELRDEQAKLERKLEELKSQADATKK